MDTLSYLLEHAQEYETPSEESFDLTNEIKFHNITHDDMLNGDGLRVVLWVAGCEHRCKECHNPCTWNPNDGLPLTQWYESEFWEWLGKSWTQGATFSGGDPLHPANRAYIASMMRQIKTKYKKKDIWVYTGYVLQYSDAEGFYFENSVTGAKFIYPGISDIDILVDGRFDCDVRRADIATKKKVKWRGSSNQRVIDVQASLKEKKIIERRDD